MRGGERKKEVFNISEATLDCLLISRVSEHSVRIYLMGQNDFYQIHFLDKCSVKMYFKTILFCFLIEAMWREYENAVGQYFVQRTSSQTGKSQYLPICLWKLSQHTLGERWGTYRAGCQSAGLTQTSEEPIKFCVFQRFTNKPLLTAVATVLKAAFTFE